MAGSPAPSPLPADTPTSSSAPSTSSSTTPTPRPDPTSTAPSLRRRRPSTDPHPPTPHADMFASRKYTPLPTNANQRRRSGVLAGWRRWAVIGTACTLVLLLGYSRLGAKTDYDAYDAENTYTPDLDGGLAAVDETDYTSPPFRPLDSDIAVPQVHDDDDDGDDGMLHALPVSPIRPVDDVALEDDIEDEPASSPHDPTSDAAKEAAGARPDFTEIDAEEQDDERPADADMDAEDEDEEEAPAHAIGAHPTSFETDPDAASTTYCDETEDGRPLVQYALTIDAGSTGSRIHVYKFQNCGPAPQLEYETFLAVQPGLSAYAHDATAAAASLDPLLEEARRVVPEALHSCTPVEVKATAGLRLLGNQESNAILDEVRTRLETTFPFAVAGERSVEIMDGKDEGVYAWITANYLLNKIGEGADSDDTLAVMDLGGASTQIVFEPKFPADADLGLVEGEHKYALTFGGRDFVLYQHSYLGYGLMRARRSVHNLVAFTWSFGQGIVNWDELSEDDEVPNPCLSKGTSRRVELDPPGRNAVNVTMHGATGGFEACNRVVELVMAKDAICEVKPCSFNGVYQPSLLDTFPSGRLLALSYFTDRIKPLLPARANSDLTIAELTSLAKDVCDGPTAWRRRWGRNTQALAELEDRPEYCLDLTFMNALLGLGYELGPERELVVEKKLRGVELGWALGAGLALVEKAELTCTA